MAPFAGESWSGFVQEHVLTRSVRDSAALLDIAEQPTPGEPYAMPPKSRPFLEEVGVAPGKLRIGYNPESLFGGDAHPDCRRAVKETVGLLKDLGHEVIEDTLPFHREDLVRAYFIVVSSGVARAVEKAAEYANRKPRSKDFEAVSWMLAQIGWANRATEYEWAREVIQREARRVAGWFEKTDIYMSSTLGRPPAQIGELLANSSERTQLAVLRTLNLRPLLQKALHEMGSGKLIYTPNTQLFNQTGQPAMSVPLHWNDAGLPIGVQFVARFAEDATLFRLASQLEKAKDWKANKPTTLTSPQT